MRRAPLLALAGLLAAASVSPSAAQEVNPGEEDPDSTRVRVQRTLDALSRGPGLDSARTHLDSIRARSDRRRNVGGVQGGVAPEDSTAGALLELEGYTPTGYASNSARFLAGERRLFLQGDSTNQPKVSRAGMTLAADSAIVFDESTGRVRALGNATYTPADGDPLESRSLVMDIESETGSALGARTRYNQAGTEWIVTGDLPAVRPRLVYGSTTSFTSCNLDEPHYHFETDRIKIHQDRVLVARPVRLYFADVPVAWLPFIAQSLGDGRSSGLLTPRFSINDIVRTSRGYNRRISNVGFYWAMSDYTDATVALDWFSGNYMAVTGQFRYNWMRKFLNGQLSFRNFWRQEGGQELTLNTRHAWEISERTQFRMSGSFATSEDFVRQQSFDPREVTQTIDSQGGLNHRFDWGSLNVGANRRQFLSEDKVTMTLPQASLSLNPMTFFQAPTSQASFYNNLTWNGSVNMSRRISDLPEQATDTTFAPSRADQVSTTAGVSSSFTLGNLSLSQSASFNGRTTQGIPDFLLSPTDGSDGSMASVSARQAAGLAAQEEVTTSDLTNESVEWSTSVNYQQRLIGSTTITPSLRLSGRSIRSDTLSEGSGFVSAPMRTSFGARLKTDMYGFYPGFGDFEAIRHKVSPSFSYDYSPEVSPTALQERVFGSREIQTKSVVSIDLNQTWEAKVQEEGDTAAAAPDTAVADTAGAQPADTTAAADTTGAGGGGRSPLDEEGLERLDTGRKLTLLALTTSVVTYDFVQADSAGDFLGGFETTRLSNSVRSDYLRGLSIQFSHDLFEQADPGGGGGGGSAIPRGAGRTFAPHLSSVNLSFSLNNRSGILGLLGLGEGDGQDGGEEELQAQQGDPFASQGGPDESSVVPDGSSQQQDRGQGGLQGSVGEWNANISYSLQRPRDESRESSQMVQLNLGFRPTQQWDVRWRTSYDANAGRFNDHMIRLTRDLHRWRANFDFRQTATGNWSFRFEVSLMDNEDLHFDYEQRSRLEAGRRR